MTNPHAEIVQYRNCGLRPFEGWGLEYVPLLTWAILRAKSAGEMPLRPNLFRLAPGANPVALQKTRANEASLQRLGDLLLGGVPASLALLAHDKVAPIAWI